MMKFDPRSPKSVAQVEAIDAGLTCLQSFDRTRIAMACGTGKTYVQVRMAQGLINKRREAGHGPHRIVVHVPTLSLVKQNLDEWRTHQSWGRDFKWIAVCSDQALTKADSVEEIQLDSSELEELGLSQQTTDELEDDRVSTWLAENESQNPNAVSVIFTTYQSAPVVGSALKHLGDYTGRQEGIDVGIFDEAHKTAGKDLDRKSAYSLFDDNMLIRKRMFYTATERVLDLAGGEDSTGQYDVISMEDEALYGPRAFNLSFREAASRGIVAPYKIMISVINDDEFSEEDIERMEVKDSKGEIFAAKDVATMAAIQRAMQQKNLKKGIVFHQRVADSKRFSEMGDLSFGMRLENLHIDGSMPGAVRRAAMDAYAQESTRSIISNAKCLTEGVNVPETDLIAFADAKRSKVDIVQAVGRSIRLHEGKDFGYILLPLHVSMREGESPEVALERSARDFKQIRDVLRALAESDEVLQQKMRVFSERAGESSNSSLGPFDLFDSLSEIDVEIQGDWISKTVGMEALSLAISTRLINEAVDDWMSWLGEWKSFKARHGREPSSNSKDPYEKSLGSWEIRQRKTFQQGKMSAERIQLLREAGFVLESLIDVQWQENFEGWKSFKATHGREPSGDATDPYERSLGKWVSNQRNAFKQGRMSDERIQLLQEAGFVLETIDRDFHWQENFEGWKSFKATHGREPSKNAKDPYEKSLGVWVHNQRTTFKQGDMSAERIQLLQETRFVFGAVLNNQWQEAFEGWKSFKVTHGREPSKESKDLYERSLGKWANTQRAVFKQGKMPDERIQLLQEAGFVLETIDRDFQWLEHLEGWKFFKATHGREPSSHSKDPYEKLLGSWAIRQRKMFRRDKMSAERIQLLQEAGFKFPSEKQEDSENQISNDGDTPAYPRLRG